MPRWTGDLKASGEAVRLPGALSRWPQQQPLQRRLSMSYRNCRGPAKGACEANSSSNFYRSRKRCVMLLRLSIERRGISSSLQSRARERPRRAEHNCRPQERKVPREVVGDTPVEARGSKTAATSFAISVICVAMQSIYNKLEASREDFCREKSKGHPFSTCR
jgi:hypothetical protein